MTNNNRLSHDLHATDAHDRIEGEQFLGNDRKIRRKRFDELLTQCVGAWNEFDPIVVCDGDDDGTRDEYDSYARQSVRMVHAGADLYKHTAFVRSVVHVSMGLSDFPDEAIDAFAEKLARVDA